MNAENPPPEAEDTYTDGSFLVEEYSRYRRIGAMFVLVALALLIVATVITALLQPDATLTPTPDDVGWLYAAFWL